MEREVWWIKRRFRHGCVVHCRCQVFRRCDFNPEQSHSVKRQGLDISFYELWLWQKLSLNLSMLAAWIALGNLFYLTSKPKLKRGLLRPIWFNVDQIWRNFATLAVFEGLIVLDNFYAYFGNFCKVLGKVFIVRNGRIWPSGHTVRINQFLAQPNLNLENKYFVTFSQKTRKK